MSCVTGNRSRSLNAGSRSVSPAWNTARSIRRSSIPPRTISRIVWTIFAVDRASLEHHRYPLHRSLTRDEAVDERREHLGGVVPAGVSGFVVADADEPGILERLETAERDVRLLGRATRGIVQEVVRDQARGGNRQAPLLTQVEGRAVDQIDGGTAGDLRVGLNIRDEELDGVEVRRDRLTQIRGEIGREQARMLRAGRVDDEIGLGDSRREPRVQCGRDRVGVERATSLGGRQLGQFSTIGVADRAIAQEDLPDAVVPPCVHDFFFTAEQAIVVVERDEKAVGAVRDVLDQAGGQPEQGAVVVHGVVELPAAGDKAAREHEIADARIGEFDRPSRAPVVVVEAPEPGRKRDTRRRIEPGRAMRACARFEIFDERSERGFGRVIRQPEVQQIDQRGRRGPANAREAGRVLAEIRRSERVAQEPPHRTRGLPVVVAVDRDRERHARVGAEQFPERTGPATAGKEHDMKIRAVRVGHGTRHYATGGRPPREPKPRPARVQNRNALFDVRSHAVRAVWSEHRWSR